MGNREKALEYFQKSLLIKEEIGEYYFASSFVEYMKGNIKEAADFNLKRELTNPADGEIWYEIARIYGLLKMEDKCSRALKKSVDMGYISYASMKNDSFLDPVRDNSGVKELIEKAGVQHNKLKMKLSTTY